MSVALGLRVCLCLLLLGLLLARAAGKVTRCFEDANCLPNDVCINYACYEIKTYEERCSFDQECSHLNRRLICKDNHCACQQNLKWIWSISKCRPPGYCQIEEDCPGSDFRCNYTLSRCQKINPIKSRARKLVRSSGACRAALHMQALALSAVLPLVLLHSSSSSFP